MLFLALINRIMSDILYCHPVTHSNIIYEELAYTIQSTDVESSGQAEP
jgi:hypothetical protein